MFSSRCCGVEEGRTKATAPIIKANPLHPVEAGAMLRKYTRSLSVSNVRVHYTRTTAAEGAVEQFLLSLPRDKETLREHWRIMILLQYCLLLYTAEVESKYVENVVWRDGVVYGICRDNWAK